MVWPFKTKTKPEPKGIVYPFRPVIQALIDKDEKLYRELCHLVPSVAVAEWRKVYPEDFPQGVLSAPSPASIVSKG